MVWKSTFAALLLAFPWSLAAQSLAAQETPAEGSTQGRVTDDGSVAESPVTDSPSETMRYLIDTGPLRIRDQFQFGMGFLAFDPVSAVVLEKGEWQVDVISTLTNAWAQSNDVEAFLDLRGSRQPLPLSELQELDAVDGKQNIAFIDGELVRSAIAIRRGLGKGVQLELVVPILSFGGGFFDSTIEDFHDTFSFGQMGRTGVAKNDFRVYVAGENGSFYLDEDPGTQLGDVVIGAKFRLREPTGDARYHLALEAVAELPAGNARRLTSNGEVDLGVQFLVTRYFDHGCLHLSAGLLALGEWREVGIDRQVLPSVMAAWEQGLGERTSMLAQVTFSATPFDDLAIEALSASSAQVTFGFKRVVYGNKVLFAGITENLLSFDSTSDIGLHLGLTATF